MSEDTFVWDTTGPLHASKVGHLDWLLDAAGRQRRHVIPSKVAEEMGGHGYPADAQQLDIEELGFEDLPLLVLWQQLLGSDEGAGINEGEAWVVTLAQRMRAVAIVDDAEALKVIRRTGAVNVSGGAQSQDAVTAHGVLWAISRGVVEKRVSGPSAYSGLCDRMMAEEEGLSAIRWPFRQGGYPRWYKANEKDLV
ncbi:MAG: hypothetical protein Q4C85_00430 [Actinomyces sp.]|uniref:hypothetical protein n=1 Tax=Actinomyces sp. TaxID=29317 RepID=UPI0026DAA6D3|nr:hypothetical protein [Actinomyces sp.]MDO4242228.1 hypothetical protein [Actinomyces sp.]